MNWFFTNSSDFQFRLKWLGKCLKFNTMPSLFICCTSDGLKLYIMMVCLHFIIRHENEFVIETQIKHTYKHGNIRQRKFSQFWVTHTYDS